MAEERPIRLRMPRKNKRRPAEAGNILVNDESVSTDEKLFRSSGDLPGGAINELSVYHLNVNKSILLFLNCSPKK